MDQDPNQPRRIAYSYKRFSSPKQSKGDSLRRQTEFEQEEVRRRGLVLDTKLNLVDRGVSAFRGQNKNFGALSSFLARVRRGKIRPGSVLLVESLDRLSRETVTEATALFLEIIAAGITVITAIPYQVYDQDAIIKSPSLVMFAMADMAAANDSSRVKACRQRSLWGRKFGRARDEGTPVSRRCPGWLRVVDDRFEVIPDRAAVVRLIFKWARSGLGHTQIAKRLNAEGHPPFGRGKVWTVSYLHQLTTKPAVHGGFQTWVSDDGVTRTKGAFLPNYFPAVVSLDEFRLTRATIASRHRRSGRPADTNINLFAGIAFHARNGSKMSMVNAGRSKGRRSQYLRANSTPRGRDRTRGWAVDLDGVERLVLTTLGNLVAVADPKLTVSADRVPSRAERDLRDRLFAIDHQLDRVANQYARAHDPVAEQAAAEQVQELKEARRDVLAAIERAREAPDSLPAGYASAAAVMSRKLSADARLELKPLVRVQLRRVVTEIWVHVIPDGPRHCEFHVQILLRAGAPLTAAARTDGQPPKHSFDGVDFRTHFLDGDAGTPVA